MAKQYDDDNYWTSSKAKGFDFDSEETHDGPIGLFGVTYSQTAQLSRQVNESVYAVSDSVRKVQVKPSPSLSSLSSSSSNSSLLRSSQPSPQCYITSKLLSSTHSMETVLSPKDAIRSLFLSLPVELGGFRKMADKLLLLDEALKLGDGDVLTAVLLFLQKSLSNTALFPILTTRPVAAEQYIAILRNQNHFNEIIELYRDMMQPKDAFALGYESCLKETDNKLLNALEHFRKNDCKGLSNIEMELEILREHIQLLERQIPIASDGSCHPQEQSSNEVSCPLIGPPATMESLIGSSLLATIQYCCQFYWNTRENLLASPLGFKKAFPITERQYVWNALVGRIRAGSDPIPVIMVKSMFGAPKIAAGLSVPCVLEVAFKLGCSPEVLDQLLALIDKGEQRCSLAKRYKRHSIVADILINNKDRLALLKYRDSIDDQNISSYIENALRISSTKWKN